MEIFRSLKPNFKNTVYGLFLIFLSLTTLYLTYCLLYAVSEKYFFDRIFFQKSIVHGYLNCDKKSCYLDQFGKRAKDIKDLFDIKTADAGPGKKVLGLATSDNKPYSIAVIGDSYVFGVGVRENERFQNILEKNLNKTRPTKIYSFGFPGDSALDNLDKYNLIKDRYPIDLYIFVLTDNDLLYWPSNRYYSNIYDDYINQCQSEKDKMIFNDNNQDYLKILFESLRSSANRCVLNLALKQYPKNAIYFVADWNLEQKSEMQSYLEPIRDSGFKMVYADDGRKLSGYKDPKYWTDDWKYFTVSKNEKHPSKLLHKMYSEILYNEITSNPGWNFMIK